MAQLKQIFSFLVVIIAGSSSFANYETMRYDSNTGRFEVVELPGAMPERLLRRQSNFNTDLPTENHSTRDHVLATRQAALTPQTNPGNPSRRPPANARQDARGNRAINCQNPQGDFACMACNCYNEADHRLYEDQVNVGKVVMTRVQLPQYPDSVCGVVKQRLQFSWFNKMLTRRPVPANDNCMKAATEALDFRGYFADHYHANYVHPRWGRNMRRVDQVGVHIYYSAYSPRNIRDTGTSTVAKL
jgi:spore germination cell wall hydrolase CwlJ-like protein